MGGSVIWGSVSEVGPAGRPPTSHELYAAGRVIGYKCFDQNYEFLKCKAKDESPTACSSQGDEVHRCVYGLFKERIGGVGPAPEPRRWD